MAGREDVLSIADGGDTIRLAESCSAGEECHIRVTVDDDAPAAQEINIRPRDLELLAETLGKAVQQYRRSGRLHANDNH
jgi:hypothetical protein